MDEKRPVSLSAFGKSLLAAAAYRDLHKPGFGGNYSGGWKVLKRDWGGTVLTHSGTNTMNYAVVWMAPEKDFAVLVVTNQGGTKAAAATDTVCSALIQRYLLGKK